MGLRAKAARRALALARMHLLLVRTYTVALNVLLRLTVRVCARSQSWLCEFVRRWAGMHREGDWGHGRSIYGIGLKQAGEGEGGCREKDGRLAG